MSVPPTTYIFPALIAAAQQRLLGPFRAADATSPERAIPLTARHTRDAQFRSLLRRGIIVEARPGHYYLDQAEIRRRNRAAQPLIIVAIVALLLVAVVALVALAS